MACATLGIAHPPGYVGYAGVGWVLCNVLPFIDSAYVVSLACLSCMVLALTLLAVLLVRLGTNAWAAGAVALLALTYGTFWESATVPEVYAPSLALLAGAIYLLFKYSRLGRRVDLYFAAILFGFLVVNRPPAALFAPGFVLALILIERQRAVGDAPEARRFGALRSILQATGWAALPVVLTLGLLVCRDRPSNPYNYIDVYVQDHGQTDELTGSLNRMTWLVTGKQFSDTMGADWGQMRSKIRWLRTQFGLRDSAPLICVLILLILGAVVLAGRCAGLAVAVIGVFVGSLVFLLQYWVHGQAADRLGLIYAGVVIAAATLTRLTPRSLPLRGQRLLALAFAITAGWTVCHGFDRYQHSNRLDATPVLADLDLASLPTRSVIYTSWGEAAPLWYARCVTDPRPDVDIRVGGPPLWDEIASLAANRAVFFSRKPDTPAGWKAAPAGRLWSAERTHD